MHLLPPTWRDLGWVMLTATLVGMTVALAVPLLSVVLEQHGAGAFTIGLNSAAGGFGIFLIAPFIGRLVARLGTVGCMRLGLGVAAICMLLFPLWIDPWPWFVIRLVLGCGGALLFVLSEAAVNALTPDAIRGRVLGVYATLFSVGYASGPLILGLAGSEGWLPFILASTLFVLGLIPAGRLGRASDRLANPEGGNGHRLLDTWRVAPIAMAAVFAYAVLEAAQFALLPVYALGRGMGEGAAAGLLSAWISGNILLQYPLGWLGDRWPRLRVMLLCAATAAAGSLLIPPAITAAPLLLWPLLVLLGGVMGGLYTLALTLVGERFQGADLTQANTAFVMTFQLGAIAGPPYAGAFMHSAAVTGLPWALALPALVLAGTLLARGRTRPAAP